MPAYSWSTVALAAIPGLSLLGRAGSPAQICALTGEVPVCALQAGDPSEVSVVWVGLLPSRALLAQPWAPPSPSGSQGQAGGAVLFRTPTQLSALRPALAQCAVGRNWCFLHLT